MLDLTPIKARERAAQNGPSGDVWFHAHAYEDIPLLVAEVERLRVLLSDCRDLMKNGVDAPYSEVRSVLDRMNWALEDAQ